MKNKKTFIIYPGRFQPFHKGHYETYEYIKQKLANKIPNSSIVIATSNKIEPNKSPFNYSEKEQIIKTMYKDIKNVVQVKSPYKPIEIFKKFNADIENDSVIFVLGKKDGDRLSNGKYFKPLKNTDDITNLNDNISTSGYIFTMPFAPNFKIHGNRVSGTIVRNAFKNNELTIDEKERIFKLIYNGFNKNIFELFMNKFSNKDLEEMTTTADISTPAHKYAFMSKEDFIKSQNNMNNKWYYNYSIVNENVKNKLLEGGAYGHLNHIYDDDELTFNDLKIITNQALQGNLSIENNAEIKTDGQNLMISYRDGEVIAARNKSHLKNSGAKAMKIKDVAKKFDGRGKIKDAFVIAIKNLQKYFNNMNKDKLKKYFDEGQNFASIEIIYPPTQNVIKYGFSAIIFHTLLIYDDNGNPVGENRNAIREFETEIINLNKNNFEEFEIKELPKAYLNKDINFEDKQSEFIKMINIIKGDLSDSNTIFDYKYKRFKNKIKNDFNNKGGKIYNDSYNLLLDKGIIDKLINKYLGKSKAKITTLYKTINNIDVIDDERKKEIINMVKEWNKNKYNIVKKLLNPLENLIFALSVQVLKNLKNYLVINPEDTIKTLVKDIDKTISIIKSNKLEPKLMSKVDDILNKVNSIKGGFDNVIPEEGITFVYNGKLYKMTGMFAPINQLLGIFKFNSNIKLIKEHLYKNIKSNKKIQEKIINKIINTKI